MSVPDFQSLMLPILKFAGDGKEHSQGELKEAIAGQLQLTETDRKELLPSGRQLRFDNRVAWSSVYLKKAGLLESTGRGRFRITRQGMDVLKSNPSRVDTKFLMRYQSFQEFKGSSDHIDDEGDKEDKADKTPEEILEASYLELKQGLAQELLDRIMACPPSFFEQLVVDLLVAMGYGGSRKDAGEAIGRSVDGGIDGIIKEDKLGLDVVYIQAKRWDRTVGRPDVQAFAGSLEGQRARKGVMITTSQFSQDARDYVTRIEKKIILIDGGRLTQLMIDHGVGVAKVAEYIVKKVDQDYFGDGQ
jgi:restriction system protein